MDSFLYLGTLITPDLRDETDVRSRIKKATTQFGALRPFFWHPNINIETKTTVYTATALNTALWDRVAKHGPLPTPSNVPSKYSTTAV
jgi:hypothetical protein